MGHRSVFQVSPTSAAASPRPNRKDDLQYILRLIGQVVYRESGNRKDREVAADWAVP